MMAYKNFTDGLYDERFKFTGKERDAETWYDYFGARYYMPLFKHWTSVDPLVDDYLHISPYAYCNWNPIKLVDPDGEWVAVTSNDDTTRKVFDVFQNLTTPGCTTGEPPVSWWAQQLGHDYGRAARFANRVCQPNIYNAYH